MSRIITGTIPVLIGAYTRIERLQSDTSEALFPDLHFTTADMSEYGYSLVGSAEVTVTLHGTDQIIVDKVQALRTQAVNVQAEATAKVTQIQRKINELLAITNEVAQ